MKSPRFSSCCSVSLSLAASLLASFTVASTAADWSRFRGPNGTGVATGDEAVPSQWNDATLQWKIDLPGPGHSCPIVVGDKVFLTCWTGYGADADAVGVQEDLKLHLLCIGRSDGRVLWSKAIDPVLPEENYGGMFAQHGYASHTPVSDGENVYAFFGKSGVVAFDLNGEQLWRTSVGTALDPRAWGSAASPILYKDFVIVNAAIESSAVVALDKRTGKEAWKAESDMLAGTWGTPVLVKVDDERTDLVLAVPNEIWGLNPDNGKLRWHAGGVPSNSMCASAFAQDGIVYVMGERDGGALAVRAGGKGDVTGTHTVWTANHSCRISTPVLHEGRIHWIQGDLATCVDAATGERVYRERIDGAAATEAGAADAGASNAQGGGRRRGGFGGGSDYASPVVSGGNLFHVTRAGDVIVMPLGATFSGAERRKLGEDALRADFSAAPAISDGQMFIRSTRQLFCIGASR